MAYIGLFLFMLGWNGKGTLFGFLFSTNKSQLQPDTMDIFWKHWVRVLQNLEIISYDSEYFCYLKYITLVGVLSWANSMKKETWRTYTLSFVDSWKLFLS